MQFKTTALLFALLIASSLASHEATLPQLRREKRVVEKSLSNSLGWLFSKRDECGTQYGPTYVNCGPRGCYQPSLGQVCCGSESDYCDAGNYCVGLMCCPNGLVASCCGTGFNCPANVSDYYTSASTSPPSGSTSLPVALSTSAEGSTSSAKPSTSTVPPSTSPSPTPSPTTAKSTSSVAVVTATSKTTTSVKTAGVTSTVSAGGGHGNKKGMGIEGIAMSFLGIVGFVAGML